MGHWSHDAAWLFDERLPSNNIYPGVNRSPKSDAVQRSSWPKATPQPEFSEVCFIVEVRARETKVQCRAHGFKRSIRGTGEAVGVWLTPLRVYLSRLCTAQLGFDLGGLSKH